MRLLVGGEADHVDEFRGAGPAHIRVDIEEPAVEVEGLFSVEKAIEVRFFGQVADPLVFLNLCCRFAKDKGVAGGGEKQAQEKFDRRGLARAVRPQEPEDFSLMDGQVQGIESGFLLAAPEIAIDLGQAAGLDDGIGHEAISGHPASWGSGGMRGYDNE